MELNATLLVQVVHFFCAYIIVDRILLRPAIARIQADESKHALIERDIIESQERISARMRYNEQDWYILQKRLRAECPEVAIGQHREMLCESVTGGLPRVSEVQCARIAQLQQEALSEAFTKLLRIPEGRNS